MLDTGKYITVTKVSTRKVFDNSFYLAFDLFVFKFIVVSRGAAIIFALLWVDIIRGEILDIHEQFKAASLNEKYFACLLKLRIYYFIWPHVYCLKQRHYFNDKLLRLYFQERNLGNKITMGLFDDM